MIPRSSIASPSPGIDDCVPSANVIVTRRADGDGTEPRHDPLRRSHRARSARDRARGARPARGSSSRSAAGPRRTARADPPRRRSGEFHCAISVAGSTSRQRSTWAAVHGSVAGTFDAAVGDVVGDAGDVREHVADGPPRRARQRASPTRRRRAIRATPPSRLGRRGTGVRSKSSRGGYAVAAIRWHPGRRMWELIATTASAFGLVFLAELGDKTQLLAMGFGARYPMRTVMIGLTLGFAAAGAIAALVGRRAGRGAAGEADRDRGRDPLPAVRAAHAARCRPGRRQPSRRRWSTSCTRATSCSRSR